MRLFRKIFNAVSVRHGAGRYMNLIDLVVLFLEDHAFDTEDTPFLLHNYVSLLILHIDDIEDLLT